MKQRNYNNYEIPEYLSEYFCDIAEIDANSVVLVHSMEYNVCDAVIRRNPKKVLRNIQNEVYNKAIINVLFENLDVNMIMEAYINLQDGGILITTINMDVFMETDERFALFKSFLIKNHATIKELPDTAFQNINVSVTACIIKLNK